MSTLFRRALEGFNLITEFIRFLFVSAKIFFYNLDVIINNILKIVYK